jgi:hypothetical protein
MNMNDQEMIENHQEIEMINMNVIHEGKLFFLYLSSMIIVFFLRRHHTDDSNRHHRGDDELSRSHRSSHRSPSKTNPNESSQTLNEQSEIGSEFDQPTLSSSPMNRPYRDDSERSSSRHSHHKKSSKRSRHDSGDERNSSHHHHRRSRDKSSGSNKKSTNQTEPLTDVKEQINE